MDKFATLEPTRLYAPTPTRSLFSRPSKAAATTATTVLLPTIGRLPIDLHLLILTHHLATPDIPAYARASRAAARLCADERIWEHKWRALGVDANGLGCVLDELEGRTGAGEGPPTIAVDDEFGDFTEGGGPSISPRPEEMGDFVGSFNAVLSISTQAASRPAPTFRAKYQRAHRLLKRLATPLKADSPPHIILSALSTFLAPSSPTSSHIQNPLVQAQSLHLLSLFLSPHIKPLTNWPALQSTLRAAIDRFDASLLAAFDVADSTNDEPAMRAAAVASWQVTHHSPSNTDWEMGKVWADKREIFYEQGRWDPLANIIQPSHTAAALDFAAMDAFMAHIATVLREHGARAVRVFPPASQVVLSFAERIAHEVVSEYITSLLTRARAISNAAYLQATAASFSQAWGLVDVLLEVADSGVERTMVEDIIYQMFETNMDEYLDEETDSLKAALLQTTLSWSSSHSPSHRTPLSPTTPSTNPRFLGSANPALVKRNFLASFTDVLLLPVTIVPRTLGVLSTGGTAAAQGLAMLNPQRWGANATEGYSRELELELGGEEGEGGEFVNGAEEGNAFRSSQPTPTPTRPPTPTRTRPPTPSLELFLSLDLTLELIHADRDALKRAETFAGYPGHYGHRVRDTIEEIFVLLLQALSERHVSPGFARATEQMMAYKPAEHEETTGVAPLLQFFELVHIGDTIQSMVQVYFDKELAPHIDRTDFLNGVVREKKRFENALDDSVAAGLNAGTEVLMNQVEHIILTLTPARAYYPPDDAPLDLGPTRGCTEAIRCLDMHCKLLKGSTNKEVLEVFYQEVGIRLIGILHKHIKRQIISLTGGFQVIADLNTYYVFIASLKVPQLTSEFSHLKMLGHVYVVEDARDLAQIVRDVTRYGGAYRPEDIYEFIQRRSDWKKIEKTVDKTMYNLSFKEDCVFC